MSFLTILIYIFLSFSAGLTLIALSLKLIDLKLVFYYIDKQLLPEFHLRLFTFSLGLLIILFCIRYLQLILSRKERSIIFESAKGKISITLFAIEDMLKKMLEEKKGLSHVRLKVISNKKGIEVIVRGNLTSEVNIVELKKEIQEDAKEKLRDLLGEEKDTKVNIQIGKIIFGGKKKIEQKEPEVPFRNYF
jgi:hypothetical protein